jgi:guanylate kinase
MNELQYLEDFQQALQNYQLSPDALQTVAQVKIIGLLGPTGGGRSTIIKQLLKTQPYYFIVSDTTRQPRSNDGIMEQDGCEYWFRSETDMLHDIQAGKLLEAEVIHNQQVSGISMRELGNALAADKTAIVDADVQGVQNILRLKPSAIAVLILPPSFAEWQQRLNGRGNLPAEELKRRLKTAVTIFELGLQDTRFHLLVNDNYIAAAKHLNDLASGTLPDGAATAAARQLCQQLLVDTQAHLASL